LLFWKKKNIKKESDENIKHQLEEMVEALADGIFKLDIKGKVLFANLSFSRILGYQSKNLLFETESIIAHFKTEENFSKLLELLGKHNKVKNYRISMNRKDGSSFVARINGRVNYDENLEPATIEGSLQDITGLVRKEIETKTALEKLKEETQNASKEVHEAKRTSDFKSQFLANMSHEIRTPMNSVLGFLTLIENELYENKDELKQFSANARGSAESLLDIINNILDLSKIEAGKMELEEEEFNLKDEIQKVISMITPSAKEKGVDINLRADNNVPVIVTGDSTRYRQILVNLAGNAIKFTDEGEILISLDLTGDGKVRTSVKDTGRGISEEDLKNIFEPYSQGKKNSKNKSGTGLGLVIAKEFANLMNGDISVTSKIGEGSAFIFTVQLKFEAGGEKLDLSEMEDPDSEPINLIEGNTSSIFNQEKIDFPEVNLSDKNKKRILLVEDNPISQKVELRILREVGYSVDPVSNGLEAIEAVKTGSFHLVLMDVEMSEMDGLTATKKIRELEIPVKNIPIIAVTANSSMKDREKCLAAGMDDYIAKPININFLKMTIDRWLNENR